jgi:hypothetical protein
MKDYSKQEIHTAIRLAALALWSEHVIDVHGSEKIESFFHEVGWSWIKGYKNNESFAWCGVFAGVCCMRVGNHLEPNQCVPVVVDPDIARVVMPSTYRLASSAKWKQATVHPADQWGSSVDGPLKNWLIPGAIVTISARKYGDRRDYMGGHIVIVDELTAEDEFSTIEGNGHGLFPDGKRGEGVIRRTRKLSDVRRVYHLRRDHLEFLG